MAATALPIVFGINPPHLFLVLAFPFLSRHGPSAAHSLRKLDQAGEVLIGPFARLAQFFGFPMLGIGLYHREDNAGITVIQCVENLSD